MYFNKEVRLSELIDQFTPLSTEEDLVKWVDKAEVLISDESVLKPCANTLTLGPLLAMVLNIQTNPTLTPNLTHQRLQQCIKTIINAVSTACLLTQYPIEMKNVLNLNNNDSSDLHVVVLKSLAKFDYTEADDGGLQFPREMFYRSIQLLQSTNIEVAKLAVSILTSAIENTSVVVFESLFDDKAMNMLEGQIEKDCIVQFRIYDAICDGTVNFTQKKSTQVSVKERIERYDFFESALSLTENLVTVLISDDCLLKINAIEVASKLAQIDNKYLTDTVMKLIEHKHDPFYSTYLPFIFRFIARLDFQNHNITDFMEGEYKVKHMYTSCLNGTDDVLFGAALSSLGVLLCKQHALSYVSKHMSLFIHPLLGMVTSSNSRRKSDIIVFFEKCLLSYSKSSWNNNEALKIVFSSHNVLEKKIIDVVMKMVDQPFKVERYIGLDFMRTLVIHPFCIETLLNNAEFVDWVLDMNQSSLKLGLIKTLLQYTSAIHCDGNIIKNLTDYINDSKNYTSIPSSFQVSTKGL